jgi:hypothetical protein
LIRICPGSSMEAIKKKMQAMKVEKDNACDRCAKSVTVAFKDFKIY